MKTLQEARFDAIMNFMNSEYPDFPELMGSLIVFSSKLALRLEGADEAWFMRKCEADNQTGTN